VGTWVLFLAKEKRLLSFLKCKTALTLCGKFEKKLKSRNKK
jgi:hypothetical protein